MSMKSPVGLPEDIMMIPTWATCIEGSEKDLMDLQSENGGHVLCQVKRFF